MSSEIPNKLMYSFAGKKLVCPKNNPNKKEIFEHFKGLGNAIVSRLYHDGASVFTLEKDPELVTQLHNNFPDKLKLRVEVCDITNWNETQKLIDSFGPVDHLVNCAGICKSERFLELKEDNVSIILDVNLKSLYCTSQAVAKGMVSAGVKGTIVNISSVLGHMAMEFRSHYCVAKAGVIMLTKCLAVELGKHGIRVNSVSPTAIKTPMFLQQKIEDVSVALALDDIHAKIFARQPLNDKHMLDMDDVVNSVLFLLSPLSSLANGTDLLLDGGLRAS